MLSRLLLKILKTTAVDWHFVDEVILKFGIPRIIISDLMEQVAYYLEVKKILTLLYHSESNPKKRRNRDLKTQVSILVKQKHSRWRKVFPALSFAINSAFHSSTEYTPTLLTFATKFSPLSPLKFYRTLSSSQGLYIEPR